MNMKGRIAISEIKLWIANDEGLYNWHRRSKRNLDNFIRDNREEIENYILKILGREVL